MESAAYKGIANNEYELYETSDNGRTWSLLSSEGGEAVFTYDRIIFGSTENLGLRYSDDGGKSKMPSDHPAGNWDGIAYRDGKVFAHSMDGLGIFCSEETSGNGIGEIWTKICDAAADSVLVASPETGGLHYQSDTLIDIDTGSLSYESTPNATSVGGEPVSLPVDDGGGKGIPGVLLFILNRIMLPELVYRLTGSDSASALAYFNDGITWGSTSYSAFFTDSQTLSKRGSLDEKFTEEDFRSLAGMMPFSLSVSDLSESSDVSGVPLTTEAVLPENDTLKATLELIDEIMAVKRDHAARAMAKSITSVSTPSDSLLELDSRSSELSDALKTQKMFYEVQKGSVVSVVDTIINYCYTLDTQKKIALLKAAIYETVLREAPRINYQLKELQKKLGKGTLEVTDDDLDLSYNFAAGLETAITRYLDIILMNVREITSSADNDLKTTAVDWYKASYREDVLGSLGDRFSQTSPDYTYSMFTEESLDSLAKKIGAEIAERDAWVSLARRAVSDLLASDWEAQIGADYPSFGDLAAKAVGKDSYAGKELAGLSYGDTVSRISEIQTRDIYSVHQDEIDTAFASVSEENTRLFVDSIKNSLADKMREILDEVRIDDFYDEDYESGLSDAEIRRIQGYYKALADKMRSRCLELLDLIYSRSLSNLGDDGYAYYTDLIRDRLLQSLQAKASGGSGKSLRKILESTGQNLAKLLKDSWSNFKEMI